MKIGVYGQVVKKEDKNLYETFFQKLEEKKITILVCNTYLKELYNVLGYKNSNLLSFDKEKGLPEDTRLLFTFGGDGTILTASTFIKNTNIPIVGINTGRLGFLATLQKTEILNELPRILEGNCSISERSILEVKSNKEIFYPFAINEVAVMRKETSSMITVDTYVNNVFLNSFWADGLIISTPTGSTGYSLSCGGPIIYPQADIFVITPISPHNLNVRPLILKDDVTIQLKIRGRSKEYSLSLDSRYNTMNIEDEIIIKKADYKINIVKYKNYSYFENLRQKLQWGRDSRN
ncbi:NAD kinase [Apibacter adventoris]|uniref:NAD kinase n=1 Tax=Apibacter adventoris TaxID=1679466 RepID=A0A2S8AAG9_9FLAO|nr:NAD kinase [Apibacter adventoris]PQL91588.1 NAD kinase [Apibacter adventoris]PQL93635.1 NAD kinase [Apibacter adventoris]